MQPATPSELAAGAAELPPEIREMVRSRAAPPRRSSEELLRRHRLGLGVLAALLAGLLFGPLWGPALPLPTFTAILVLILAATALDVLFINLNASCPRCGRYLGAGQARLGGGRTVPRCAHCGYVVR